jgi:hypothetical protein
MPGDALVNTAHPIDDAAFARARARIDAMDFVGLTERFAESVALFERLSGIALGPVAHSNRSRSVQATAPELDPSRLVFIDATGASTRMARLRGRAPRGARCRAAIPHGHGKTTTLVAALRLSEA